MFQSLSLGPWSRPDCSGKYAVSNMSRLFWTRDPSLPSQEAFLQLPSRVGAFLLSFLPTSPPVLDAGMSLTGGLRHKDSHVFWPIILKPLNREGCGGSRGSCGAPIDEEPHAPAPTEGVGWAGGRGLTTPVRMCGRGCWQAFPGQVLFVY